MTDLTDIVRHLKAHGTVRISRGFNNTLRVEVPNVLAVNVQYESEEEMREITQALVNAITSKPC